MKIKYLVEELYWFIKHQIHLSILDFKNVLTSISNFIKELFTIKNYIYVILATLIFVILTGYNRYINYIFWLILAIVLIYYKKYKAGNHKAYMREKKGYKLKFKP